MKIILIGSPEGQASFVKSMQTELPCERQNEMIQYHVGDQSQTLQMITMGVSEAKKIENREAISGADAVIYAGIQAMHKNRLECEYLLGFNAASLLKNLHQLLQDHQRASHSVQ